MPGPINTNSNGSSQRPMFRTLGIASTGLFAQRLRMETIATNIANAETTRTEGGGPYRRRMVEMTSAAETGVANAGPNEASALAQDRGAAAAALASADTTLANATGQDVTTGGVKVTGIVEDATEGPLVYDPSHPDANPDGYVRYPNVRVTDEIVDLMDAKRIYEANATVFQAAKSMLRRAIDI